MLTGYSDGTGKEDTHQLFVPLCTSHATASRPALRWVLHPQGPSFIWNIWDQLASSSKLLFSGRWSICQYPSCSIISYKLCPSSPLGLTSLLDPVIRMASECYSQLVYVLPNPYRFFSPLVAGDGNREQNLHHPHSQSLVLKVLLSESHQEHRSRIGVSAKEI